jgi:hypothetical protein
MYFNVYVFSGAPPKKKQRGRRGGERRTKGLEYVMESMGNARNGQDDIVQGLWQPDPE